MSHYAEQNVDFLSRREPVGVSPQGGPSPPCKRSSTEPSCLRIAQGEGGVLPGQTQPLIVLLSNVTAAVLASALPVRVAAASIVTDAPAIMFPTKALPPPIVAELPTCQ